MNLLEPNPQTGEPDKISEKQAEFLRYLADEETRYVWWIGAAGTGKTAIDCFAWIWRAVADRYARKGRGDYALVSPTLGNIQRNVRPEWELAIQQMSPLSCTYRPGDNADPRYELWIGDVRIATFHLFGGANAGTDKRLSGMNLSGVAVDEGIGCHPDFLSQCMARMRVPGAKMTVTSNAADEYHPLKKQFLDNPLPRSAIMESGLSDAPYLPEDYVEAMTSGIGSDHMTRRLAFNEWASAGGQVVPFDPRLHADNTDRPLDGAVGIDAGSGGVTAGVLLVPAEYGYQLRDEYYFNQADTGALPLSEGQHFQQMLAQWRIRQTFIDPSAVNMKSASMAAAIATTSARNDVLAGIQAVREAILTGRLRVHTERCQNWLYERSAYVWNPLTDMPVKVRDHLMDATRYAVTHLLPPALSVFVPGTVYNRPVETASGVPEARYAVRR